MGTTAIINNSDMNAYNQAQDANNRRQRQAVKADRTTTATVIDATRAAEGLYYVKDKNLAQYWVQSEQTDYQEGDEVRVTIPDGDYSQTKYIDGRVMHSSEDDVTSLVDEIGFIPFTDNLISSTALTCNLLSSENRQLRRWLTNRQVKCLYTSVEVDVNPGVNSVNSLDNFDNTDVMTGNGHDTDAYGVELILTFNKDPEHPTPVKLLFTASNFVGCLFNTRIFNLNRAEYFKQEIMFDLSEYDTSKLKTIEWVWHDYWTAGSIQATARRPVLKLGLNKKDFTGQDMISIYTDEVFVNNEFFVGATADPPQTKATFNLEWLYYDEKEKCMRQHNSLPNPDYRVYWYEYKLGMQPTPEDPYSTVNWPRALVGFNQLFADYKNLFYDFSLEIGRVNSSAYDTSSGFVSALREIRNQYNSMEGGFFDIAKAITALNTENPSIFESLNFDWTNSVYNISTTNSGTETIVFLNQLITAMQAEFNSGTYEFNAVIQRYRHAIETDLCEIPYFQMIKKLTFDMGKTGACAVIEYQGQPYLSEIYTNKIILSNGDTAGLSEKEYGNSLTLVPSDDSNGIYFIYNLNNSLRDLSQSNIVRELTVYYDGKPIDVADVQSIEWHVPTENTMISAMPKYLYQGRELLIETSSLTNGHDYNVFYYDSNSNNYVSVVDEVRSKSPGKLLDEITFDDIENSNNKTFFYIDWAASTNETYKYKKINYIRTPSMFDGQKQTLYEQISSGSNGVSERVMNVNEPFKICANYIIRNYGDKKKHKQDKLLYSIAPQLNRNKTNNFVSVIVQFKNGTVCSGGIHFKFDTMGTNGTPYNFYLTEANNGPAVLTYATGKELLIHAKLFDAQSGSDLTKNLRNVKWTLDYGVGDKLAIATTQTPSTSCKLTPDIGKPIYNNKMVLRASCVYDKYNLEAFLPIALRTADKYAWFDCTTDLYYDNSSNLLMGTETSSIPNLKVLENNELISANAVYYEDYAARREPLFLQFDVIQRAENQSYYNVYKNGKKLGVLYHLDQSSDKKLELVIADDEQPRINLFGQYYILCYKTGDIIDTEIRKDISETPSTEEAEIIQNEEKETYTNIITHEQFLAKTSESNNRRLSTNKRTVIKIGNLKKEIWTDPAAIINQYSLTAYLRKQREQGVRHPSANIINIERTSVSLLFGQEDDYPRINLSKNTGTKNQFWWEQNISSEDAKIDQLTFEKYEFVNLKNDDYLLNEHTICAGFEPNGAVNIVWVQPIVQVRNTYPSAVVNKWNGDVDTEGTDGSIKAPMFVAGHKDANNKLTGVVLGTPQGDVDQTMNYTGIYGYQQGIQTYGLRADGTAFFGATGAGQIQFDGTKGIIQSGNYSPIGVRAGMKIDLDDGLIDSYNFKLTSKNILLDSSETADTYFEVKNSADPQKILMRIGKMNPESINNFIQSQNYNASSHTGVLFDLDNGNLMVGDGSLSFGQQITYWDQEKAIGFGFSTLAAIDHFFTSGDYETYYSSAKPRKALRYSVALDSIFKDAVVFAWHAVEEDFGTVSNPVYITDEYNIDNGTYNVPNAKVELFLTVMIAYLCYYLNPVITDDIRVIQDQESGTYRYGGGPNDNGTLTGKIYKLESGEEVTVGDQPYSILPFPRAVSDNKTITFTVKNNQITSFIYNYEEISNGNVIEKTRDCTQYIKRIDDSMNGSITRFLMRAMVNLENKASETEQLIIDSRGIQSTKETSITRTDGENSTTTTETAYNFGLGQRSILPEISSTALILTQSDPDILELKSPILYLEGETTKGLVVNMTSQMSGTAIPPFEREGASDLSFFDSGIADKSIYIRKREHTEAVEEINSDNETVTVNKIKYETVYPYRYHLKDQRWVPVYFPISPDNISEDVAANVAATLAEYDISTVAELQQTIDGLTSRIEALENQLNT